MSVTQGYKTPILSGAQCFAVLRSLRARAIDLEAQIKRAEGVGDNDLVRYMHEQRAQAHLVIDIFENTPFQGNLPEGAKS